MKLSYPILFVLLGFLNQGLCILDGEVVKLKDLNKYKYLVSIFIHDGETGKRYTCGGGILNDRMILTAAHCFANWRENDVQDLESIRVTARTLSSRRESINQGSIVRKVEKIYVPKEYFGAGFADIAILRLKKSLNLFFNIRKLTAMKLPEQNFVTLDKEAVVAGYGSYKPESGGDDPSDDVLRTMTVKVVPKPDYDTDPLTDESVVKAKPIGDQPAKGLCDGDSGSPLVIVTKKFIGTDYTVIGVVLGNSEDCDDRTKPGSYTRVTTYLTKFIKKVLDNPNINDDSIKVKYVGDTTTSCFG